MNISAHLIILQSRDCCWMQGLLLKVIWVQNTFQYRECLSVGVNLVVGYQFAFSMVHDAFSHKALPSGCGEKPINLAITCDVKCVCISGEGLWKHTHYIFFIVILKFPVWRQENYLYQSIKNLLCKHEDLSSIPSIDIQSQV